MRRNPQEAQTAWRIARSAAASLGIAAGTGTLGLLASGWYCASELLEPARTGDPYSLRVLALDPFAVTLPATDDTRQPGTCTLEWVGGYGLLGPVVAMTDLGARRALTDRAGTDLTVGTRTRIKRNAVDGTPAKAFGLTYEEVEVPAGLGPMPAWLVPAPGGTSGPWAVAVHGLGHGRSPMLRYLPELHRAGLTSLTITYRNDVGAPASPDGLHHLGDTEWLDVEAAVQEAQRRGAGPVVLIGDSMGAAIVLQFLQRSALAAGVSGVVLDSPVLDWNATLALAARRLRLPWLLTSVAKEIARRRIGIDWARFDQVRRAGELTLPVLLVHGDADPTVPVGPSDALAERRPDLVTYVRVPGAEHLGGWTADQHRCTEALHAFLQEIRSGDAPGGARRSDPSDRPGTH